MANRLVRNSVFSAVAALSTAIAGLVSSIIVARLLGPAGTGRTAYLLWLVTFGVTVLDLGLHSTLARFIPELAMGEDRNDVNPCIAMLLRFYLIVSALCVGGVTIYLLLAPDASSVDHLWWQGRIAEIVVASVLCVVQLLANFGLGVLRGLQEFGRAARLTLAFAVLQLVCIAVGSAWFGVDGALLGYCAGGLGLALKALSLVGGRASMSAVLVRRLFRFAAYTWLGNIAALFVWSRSELFFLDRFWGPHEVGLFSIGLTFANLASQAPMLLSGALLAYFSEKATSNAEEMMRARFAMGTRVMAFIAFPLCFGTAAILPALLPLMYGHLFDQAILPASIVTAAAAIGAPGVVGTNMMYAKDRSDFIFLVTLVGAGISILLGVIVIPAFGLLGAAFGRLAVQIFMVTLGCRFLSKTLACPVPYAELGKLLLSAIACAVVARACLLWGTGPAALLIAIALGAVTYFAAVRLLKALPAQDIAYIGAIGGMLPTRIRWLPAGALRLISQSQPI